MCAYARVCVLNHTIIRHEIQQALDLTSLSSIVMLKVVERKFNGASVWNFMYGRNIWSALSFHFTAESRCIENPECQNNPDQPEQPYFYECFDHVHTQIARLYLTSANKQRTQWMAVQLHSFNLYSYSLAYCRPLSVIVQTNFSLLQLNNSG